MGFLMSFIKFLDEICFCKAQRKVNLNSILEHINMKNQLKIVHNAIFYVYKIYNLAKHDYRPVSKLCAVIIFVHETRFSKIAPLQH